MTPPCGNPRRSTYATTAKRRGRLRCTTESHGGRPPGPPVIDVDWDAPALPGTSAIIEYQVEDVGDWQSPVDAADDHGPDLVPAHESYRGRHPPLPGQSEERQRLRALDVPGERHYVNGNAAGTAPRPEGGRRRPLGDRPELARPRWISGSSAIIGYRIEWSSTRTSGGWQDLEANTGDPRTTTYQDTGLAPNTTRYYRVSAINSFGTGPPLEASKAPSQSWSVPDAPGRLDGPGSRDIGHRVGIGGRHRPAERPQVTGLPDPVVEQGNRRMEGSRGRHGFDDDADTYQDSRACRAGTRRATTASRRLSGARSSAWSNVAHATTDDLTVPGAPTGLRVIPNALRGRTELLLTWTASGQRTAGAPSQATASRGAASRTSAPGESTCPAPAAATAPGAPTLDTRSQS